MLARPELSILSKGARRAAVAALAIPVAFSLGATEVRAQQLIHRFENPSFGGNPFNSEHLIAIANIHRPEEPKDPVPQPPTEQELIARQIESRLLSQLSTDILNRISNARPGDTGEFVLGSETIRFVRTATETRVTFVNTTTGVSREVVIPVRPAGAAGAQFGLAAGASSAEAALGAKGSLLGSASRPGSSRKAARHSSAEIPSGPPGL